MSRKVYYVLLVLSIIISQSGCLYGNIVDNKYRTNCVGNLTPCTTGVYGLGSNTYQWANGYFDRLQSDRYDIYDNTTYITYGGGGDMTFTDTVTGTKTLAQLATGSSGNVTGGGAPTRLAYWDGATSLGDTNIYFDVPQGYYGIGTTTPDTMLHVHDGSGANQLQLSYTEGSIYTNITSNHLGYLILNPTGDRAVLSGNLSVNTHYINDVVDPSVAQDAATKNYVDTAIAGIPAGSGNTTGAGTLGYLTTWASASTLTNSATTDAVLTRTVYEAGNNEGILAEPTLTDNHDGTVLVSSVSVLARSSSDHTGGSLLMLTIPAANVTLTNNSVNYIYANTSTGAAVYQASTDRGVINVSNIIPVFRVYEESNSVEYQISYGAIGNSATTKNFERVMRIRGSYGAERESGLTLSETATRIVNVGSGYAWFGLERNAYSAVNSSVAGFEIWYHTTGGAWTSNSTATQYQNTNYDNGTALVALTPNRYAVNWVYRNLDEDEIDVVVGRGDYTLAQALASTVPSVPDQVAYFYILVGRIIVQKNASSATAIENVATTTFQPSQVANHNDLSNIQGGASGDYYHVTNAELTSLKTSGINYIIDGGGSAITTGIKGDLEIPFACAISQATALADTTGNITVSIWKDTYANYPPTSTDNITASAPVTITSSNKSQDSTLSGWTKTITAGDILRYNVDSCATIKRVTISLMVNK